VSGAAAAAADQPPHSPAMLVFQPAAAAKNKPGVMPGIARGIRRYNTTGLGTCARLIKVNITLE